MTRVLLVAAGRWVVVMLAGLAGFGVLVAVLERADRALAEVCPCGDHEGSHARTHALTQGTHAPHARVTARGERAGHGLGRGVTHL